MKLEYEVAEAKILKRYAGSLDWILHVVNSVEVIVMLKGSCTAVCEGSSYEITEGDLFVTFPYQVHGFQDSKDLECYKMTIPMKLLEGDDFQRYRNTVPVSPVLRRGEWEDSGLPELFRMATSDPLCVHISAKMCYAALILIKLLYILELRPKRQDHIDTLHAILMYIDENYTQPITRVEIARAVGYDVSYISHLFSRTMKMSFSEYTQSLRLEDAQKLLAQTDLSVTQIASDLGFGSIRTFNRVFLEKNGMPPKAYRRSHSGKEP